MRIICVRTGSKYDEWWEKNLKHMIDNFSGLEYDEFVCIKDDVYDLQVANKLLMFDHFRDGQNLYFDLDVVIKGDCNQFIRDDLTVCHAWWRDIWNSPYNSSIISWSGDYSHVFKKWDADSDYHQVKYYQGIDQYLYEQISPDIYKTGFCSYQTECDDKPEYSVVLFNQRYEEMKKEPWCKKYLL